MQILQQKCNYFIKYVGIQLQMKKRVMAVDDEYDVTYSLKRALEETELFQVDGFTDPVKALSLFRHNRYDVVILDIRMPSMNGFELYEKIKAIDAKVKVLFLTAVHDLSVYKKVYTDLIERLEKDNIDCFIDKPVGSQNLLKKISKTTHTHSSNISKNR
jgi:two-component system, OmpR family, response regulator ChvI